MRKVNHKIEIYDLFDVELEIQHPELYLGLRSYPLIKGWQNNEDSFKRGMLDELGITKSIDGLTLDFLFSECQKRDFFKIEEEKVEIPLRVVNFLYRHRLGPGQHDSNDTRSLSWNQFTQLGRKRSIKVEEVYTPSEK